MSQQFFWFTKLATKLDVLAHRFTHAVVQHTASLPYVAYAGALDEALADTFAAFIDTAESWQIVDRVLNNPASQDLGLQRREARRSA